jgi:hypothetical protein
MANAPSTTVMLESPRVGRLINIAGRWQLLSRLAGDISVLADTAWEAVLLRTQSDTARAVLELIDVLHPAAAELRVENLESADGWEVEPLAFGQAQAEIIAELGRRALVASRLLQPLLNQLPENSSTWWDARKIVDRLAFDARELLEYVRLVDPERASEVLEATK